MLELVTVEEAKQQLRVDDSSYDAWLAMVIPAVSQAVRTWLKDDWRLYVPEVDSNGPVTDSNGDPVPTEDVNPLVKLATMAEIASQMRFREGEGDNRMESMGSIFAAGAHGYILNKTSTALLSGLRKPTVA
jgi:hypothetical protein